MYSILPAAGEMISMLPCRPVARSLLTICHSVRGQVFLTSAAFACTANLAKFAGDAIHCIWLIANS